MALPSLGKFTQARTRFAGISTAVPAQSISQDQAAWLAAQLHPQGSRESLIKALYRRSGVDRRGSVLLEGIDSNGQPLQSFYRPLSEDELHGPSTQRRMSAYAEFAAPLAFEAAANSLCDAKLAPAQITHLVTVSCTGFQAPGFDLALIERLGLSPAIQRTHIGFMGCHGVLNGMRVARALAMSEPGACVLLCAVELCSLHHQYTTDTEGIVANSLFSDGAAACIVQAADDEVSFDDQGSCELRGQASHVVVNTDDLMSWNIADQGFRMTLSPKVPDTIRGQLRPWLEGFLAGYDLSVEQIPNWVVHPGGPRILSAVAESLSLSDAQMLPSRETLRLHGNMSSPTVLFILQRILSQSVSGPCVMLAFGPGLTIEAALCELNG